MEQGLLAAMQIKLNLHFSGIFCWEESRPAVQYVHQHVHPNHILQKGV